ncbi:hypothetical protein L3Q82_007507 [Scortum barcoo]|uniref:Uncharacterized protein n=1 Tax=Scortum barcoo TaxID=214431 RepID=A0ACB8WND1_9TELE|nr:hypothetical protein L3Q82_007507 [Scortum barcoo]
MESPVGSTIKYPPRDSKKARSTLYCCSARRHKQQQETYPQPKGIKEATLSFTGVNSNTWRLSWGAISKPTPARSRSHPGQLQSSGGSSPSQGAGFQSPKLCVEVSPTISRQVPLNLPHTQAQAPFPQPARGTIESVLTSSITVWYGACSASCRKTLQFIVRAAEKMVGASLPSLQDTYISRLTRKALCITRDPTHPSHSFFSLLPSGRRLHCGALHGPGPAD